MQKHIECTSDVMFHIVQFDPSIIKGKVIIQAKRLARHLYYTMLEEKMYKLDLLLK